MKNCEKFIQQSTIIHNNKYDYSLVEYIKASIKVKIICPIHGEFLQTPDKHKNIKCGCPSCGYAKQKQTFVGKYDGYPQQNKEIREKTKQTNFKRYGVENVSQCNIVKNKKKQLNVDKYGVSSFFQQHMIDILPLIQDYDWLFDQYITQNKTATQIANELNVDAATICTYLRTLKITIKQNYWKSYKSDCWLNSIQEKEKIIIIPEYKIPETRYRVDGYCFNTNTIYEFYGDYWHGNPKIYSSNYINEVNSFTMGKLFEETIKRENLIKSLGYNLIIMWENEYEPAFI